MKTLKIFALTFFCAINAQAQSVQQIVLDEFNKIKLNNSVTATLTQGNENTISFSEVKPGFRYKVSGSTLQLDGVSPKNVNITFKQLNDIDISGVGTLASTGKIKTDKLNIEISGSGKLILALDAVEIKADISGVGKMDLSGTANDLRADISGSGKINAENLTVKNAKFDISGTGNAYVNVTDNLETDISGSGSVYYVNAPANIKSNVSGIGHVSKENSESPSDTTRIHVGSNKFEIISNIDSVTSFFGKKKDRSATSHWAGLDLGFNGYFDKNNSDNLPAGYDFLELIPEKSVAVNINLFDFNYKLYKHYIIATTGIGLSYNNYRFRKNFSLIADTTTIWYHPDTINYTKNKLTVSYITIPLLLTFNSSETFRKAFHLTTGILFSYKIGSHSKHVYDENGDKKKVKQYDDFNLEPFRYDATARVGYRNYTLFANYALSEMFKKNQGPVLHPWSFGISILGW